MATLAGPSFDSIARELQDFGSSHPEIQAIFVFGSMASGKTHSSSDVDIAILLRNTLSREESSELSMTYAIGLEDLLQRPVDVAILNSASPMLRYQVIRKGKLVHTRDEAGTRRFMGKALVEFYDEIEMIERMQKRAIERLIGR